MGGLGMEMLRVGLEGWCRHDAGFIMEFSRRTGVSFHGAWVMPWTRKERGVADAFGKVKVKVGIDMRRLRRVWGSQPLNHHWLLRRGTVRA